MASLAKHSIRFNLLGRGVWRRDGVGMKFGIVVDVTESTAGIVELAKAVECAGLDPSF